MDYTTHIEFGSETVTVNVEYDYDPGYADIPPSMNFPGEPGCGPDVWIGHIEIRESDDSADWVSCTGALHRLVIHALGGVKALEEDLIAHAEGRAQDDAEGLGDYLMERARDRAMGDAA